MLSQALGGVSAHSAHVGAAQSLSGARRRVAKLLRAFAQRLRQGESERRSEPYIWLLCSVGSSLHSTCRRAPQQKTGSIVVVGARRW